MHMTLIDSHPHIHTGLLADCRIRSGSLLPDDTPPSSSSSSPSSSLSLPAHRAILAARCPRVASHFHFMDAATGRSSEGGCMPTYTFPSLSPRTLAPFLSYIYTDRLDG